MHKYFADWYREADLTISAEVIVKRSVGIESFYKDMDNEKCANLIKVLFGMVGETDVFVDKFRLPFYEADSTFPMRGNSHELSILAGATILHVIEKSGDYDVTIALGTLTASFMRASNTPPIPDIIREAENFLLEESAKVRSRIELNSSKILQLKMIPAITKIKTDSEAAGSVTNPQMLELMQAIILTADSLNKVVKNNNELSEKAASTINVLSEEVNMLWWLFGERSNDIDLKMADIDPKAVCLVVGKELADLTQMLPGPLATKAFLAKMMESGRDGFPSKVKLKDCINKTSRDWRELWINSRDLNVVAELCPVHLAAKTSLMTGEAEEWDAVFKKICGAAIVEKSPLELAEQVYRESLLLKSLAYGE
jgi:hypothetical protein